MVATTVPWRWCPSGRWLHGNRCTAARHRMELWPNVSKFNEPKIICGAPFRTHTNEREIWALARTAPTACAQFRRDEWRWLKTPLAACTCDAACGNVCRNRVCGRSDASNTSHNPMHRIFCNYCVYHICPCQMCDYLPDENNRKLNEEPRPTVGVWCIVNRCITSIVDRVPGECGAQ